MSPAIRTEVDVVHLSNPLVRRLLLFGVPLAVIALGLIHPGGMTNPGNDGDTTFEQLSDQAGLFVAVHLLQLLVVGLLALVVWRLTDGLRGPAATVSRAATLTFLVVFTAFDAVQGIAVGVLVQEAHDLPVAAQGGASDLIEGYQDSLITGHFDVLGGLASLAWLVALAATAVALRRAGAGTLTVACLLLAGVFFAIGSRVAASR